MSVYVDDMKAQFGRMVMCHMVADTTRELHEMAIRLGLKRSWLQKAGTYQEHYDLSLEKRKQALYLGAKEIKYGKELAEFLLKKKQNELAAASRRQKAGLK